MLSQDKIIELYKSNKKQLVYYVNKLLRDYSNSEDIVHDAFVNLIVYSEKYELSENNLKSFLYKICRNLSINVLNRRNHFQFVPIEVIEKDHHYYSIQEPIENSEINHFFEQVLNTLSVTHSMIFKLKLINQLNNHQIADELKISERTVRRKIRESQNLIKQNPGLGQELHTYYQI